MNTFKTRRGDAGIGERVKEQLQAAGQAQGWEGVADWALQRYDVRVRAKLRRIGLDVPEDGPLTIESIKDTINRRTGLDVQDLSVEGLREAFDKRLAVELSEALGVEVSTVFDSEAMQEQVKTAVIAKLAEGGGGSIIRGRNMTLLRASATFARAGLSQAARIQAMNRIYQKRYRRSHKQIYQ
jgi:hypothetical protein